MDVFKLRSEVIGEYGRYVRSFVRIRDPRIDRLVDEKLTGGFLWPDPLVQLNPSFAPGRPLAELVADGTLHPQCREIFRQRNDQGEDLGPLRLHRHQVDAIAAAREGDHYLLTTGTGSGKSLSYIVPIVDQVLREGSGRGIRALIVYPMNALANSQLGELGKFLCPPGGRPPVSFRRYTGQEKDVERKAIQADPPDVLLTNYVMLELILTRPSERPLVAAMANLRFLVLDELHSYRGRQGADVAMLVRRLREASGARDLLHVGTSATLAGGGSWREQQEKVAELAATLFGVPVRPERIIGETLQPATGCADDDSLLAKVRARLDDEDDPPADAGAFRADPLAAWIESHLGLRREPQSGRLIRGEPRSLRAAAGELAQQTGVDRERCLAKLEATLLAGYRCGVFAFRLHQFLAKGESVYATLESAERREATLEPQRFAPGSGRAKILLPLAFCRECGQEYYVVRRSEDEDGRVSYLPRDLSERQETDDGEAGFLYVGPWPAAPAAQLAELPDSWTELRGEHLVVVRARRDDLPRPVRLSLLGVEGGGEPAWYLDAPFRFCLRCKVAYDAHQQSDFAKLATLGSEGRSTATTVLTLSTVRRLRGDAAIEPTARKLLSFTDNRQDASLQAGHFNDFVEIVLLRSALWRAVSAAGDDGLRHDVLTRRVFDALELPFALYARNPRAEYGEREDTDRALRRVLGYHLYRDLRRGWRITSPNLEQCGLLEIDYLYLRRLCEDHEKWRELHPALATATAEERERVCRVLLDHLRRELAIRVDYLDPVEQESLGLDARQRLVDPWTLEGEEKLEKSRIVLPRSRGEERRAGRRRRAVVERFSYLSSRSGFGLYLRRRDTLAGYGEALRLTDVAQILRELLELLRIPGLVARVLEVDDDPGYQLNASGILWRAGDGTAAFHDPVRVPNAPAEGLQPNPFFKDFYRAPTAGLLNLRAREHTAQVPQEERIAREEAFGEARLPVLFCSPTMELGVDIRELNAVGLRNVPPTPANYAQRSGRAGRGGQPAFVFAYCSAGSPHDQYFFKRPERMVTGSVTTPRLELANEDLLRAHVHAMYLREARLELGSSLADVLELGGEEPTLELKDEVREKLLHEPFRARTRDRALASLGAAIRELPGHAGDPRAWLEAVLSELPRSFERACERWRTLYRAAFHQARQQGEIATDASRDPRDRDQAKRLRAEAERQLELLLYRSRDGDLQADFYSYRYFASEGFLPGYSFPRLPLSAYLPGRKSRLCEDDDFLSRPRFLAIAEFGPRSIIYHEGSRYEVNRAILPIRDEARPITHRAVQCASCGYLHILSGETAPDLCERCGDELPAPYTNLFKMQNASTRRRDRINSDEEERRRLGYEIKTGVRFSERAGRSSRSAVLRGGGGEELAGLEYGAAATVWRLNLGERRRGDRRRLGYQLDVERGYWARQDTVPGEDRLTPRLERVIPYVEDQRNCLLLRPATTDLGAMASLTAVLKAAIQVTFQLEDRELAAEALPDACDRRLILFYEAAEGGVGVLRRLIDDPDAIVEVARTALEICHFDPETGADRRRAPGRDEDCEAACYDCLLSYYNQRDHRHLDRHALPELLLAWARGTLVASPTDEPRARHLERLLRLADSELERRWLRLVERLGLRLPDDAQNLIDTCRVRPDFFYRDHDLAVFVDGPPHDAADQRARDEEQQDALEAEGYQVLRFHHRADWEEMLRAHPGVFLAVAVRQ